MSRLNCMVVCRKRVIRKAEKGKAKMKAMGKIDIPKEAFLAY